MNLHVNIVKKDCNIQNKCVSYKDKADVEMCTQCLKGNYVSKIFGKSSFLSIQHEFLNECKDYPGFPEFCHQVKGFIFKDDKIISVSLILV